MVISKPSFADAKILKYVLQHHISSYLSCDVTQVENALSDVLGDEVAG